MNVDKAKERVARRTRSFTCLKPRSCGLRARIQVTSQQFFGSRPLFAIAWIET
jgi:hypothetical protein